MTRKEIMNRLAELGIKDVESKYMDIRDFLKANATPLKAITQIEVSDNDEGADIFDEDVWTVVVELGDEFGWLEV